MTESTILTREQRIRRWLDFLSAAMLALATIATAWSAYQSTLWGGDQASHETQAGIATIKAGQTYSLVSQQRALHVSLFGQWATAFSADNTTLADFIYERFPEPLKAASDAWRATDPLNNPDAPASPFDMPQYVLPAQAEVVRWEELAATETAASERAGEISDSYLMFTIIFASVLFFAGITNKFQRLEIDVAVLIFGAIVLLGGMIALVTTPVQFAIF